jgi:type IV pilus assembly protein PilW
MKKARISNKGFTLVELMVAMAIAAMVIAGIFALFRNQVATHNTERLVLSMQQNLRAAVSFMERDVRLAGSDPEGISGAGILSADESQLQFQTDTNEDGTIGAGETITYGLNGGNLVRSTSTANPPVLAGAPVVAWNIDALNFDYFDSDGNNISDKSVIPWVVPVTDIASVQVSIVARSGNAIPGLFIRHTDTQVYRNQSGDVILDKSGGNADEFRRMQLTTEVDCRNVMN